MNGWRLTAGLSVLLLAMTAGVLALHPDVEGLRMVIRATARTSLVLFALAFSAAAMAELVPSDATRWQRRNRRYLGVSFAVSHVIHLATLIVLARTDAALFWTLTNIANIVLAGAAYFFIAALTATSFDRAVIWFGVRRWRLLHLIGGWYIWATFAVAVGKRLPQGPAYWIMMAVVLGVGILRLVAMSRRARRTAVISA